MRAACCIHGRSPFAQDVNMVSPVHGLLELGRLYLGVEVIAYAIFIIRYYTTLYSIIPYHIILYTILDRPFYFLAIQTSLSRLFTGAAV